MSWLHRAVAPRAAITESHALAELLRLGMETDSGAVVTVDSALRQAWVYMCVRVLAETVAQVPLLLYQRTEGGKERATAHPIYRLLHDRPNPWQTSFEWREMMQAHVALAGNGYSLKTVVRGELRELLPIPPWRMEVTRQPDWSLKYVLLLPDGTKKDVPADLVFHVPGLAWDGLGGLSPIAYQREAVGMAMQTTKFAARMFRNRAEIAGVLEHPQVMSQQAYDRLKSSFEEKYAGVDNAHKTILLEEGARYRATGMSARDAQFIEARQMTRTEIAGIFRIPPHMIGALERATFSNIEQMALEFVMYTMQPWFTRWEQRISMQLLSPKDQETYFAEHLIDGLLRGDYKTRMDGYRTGIDGGWMTPNQVREKENMNRGPAELDQYRRPLNMDTTGGQTV